MINFKNYLYIDFKYHIICQINQFNNTSNIPTVDFKIKENILIDYHKNISSLCCTFIDNKINNISISIFNILGIEDIVVNLNNNFLRYTYNHMRSGSKIMYPLIKYQQRVLDNKDIICINFSNNRKLYKIYCDRFSRSRTFAEVLNLSDNNFTGFKMGMEILINESNKSLDNIINSLGNAHICISLNDHICLVYSGVHLCPQLKNKPIIMLMEFFLDREFKCYKRTVCGTLCPCLANVIKNYNNITNTNNWYFTHNEQINFTSNN